MIDVFVETANAIHCHKDINWKAFLAPWRTLHDDNQSRNVEKIFQHFDISQKWWSRLREELKGQPEIKNLNEIQRNQEEINDLCAVIRPKLENSNPIHVGEHDGMPEQFLDMEGDSSDLRDESIVELGEIGRARIRFANAYNSLYEAFKSLEKMIKPGQQMKTLEIKHILQKRTEINEQIVLLRESQADIMEHLKIVDPLLDDYIEDCDARINSLIQYLRMLESGISELMSSEDEEYIKRLIADEKKQLITR